MHQKRGLCQGGIDPAQSRDFIGLIHRAGRKGTCVRWQVSLDGGVALVQAPGYRDGLVEGAEYHAENDREGPMEAAKRISECPRVCGDGFRYPGMGQLKQQSAASTQKDRRLTINPPDHRSRTEDPFGTARRERSDGLQLLLRALRLIASIVILPKRLGQG